MVNKEVRLAKILKAVPDVSKIIRGTLIKRFTLCGNKNCRCHKTGKKHGPNWYLVYSENKKTHHIYIPRDKVRIIKKYIKNYNIFWEQLNKISKLNIKIIKKSGRKKE